MIDGNPTSLVEEQEGMVRVKRAAGARKGGKRRMGGRKKGNGKKGQNGKKGKKGKKGRTWFPGFRPGAPVKPPGAPTRRRRRN